MRFRVTPWIIFLMLLYQVNISPKVFSLKVNVIAQLEFKLANYEVRVQHVNHYAMGTLL